jgi:hypothetical protein
MTLINSVIRPQRLVRVSKANARSSAVLIDELDAGRFQRSLNRFEVVRHRNRSACFEISDGAFTNLCSGRQVGLGKLDESARGAALGWSHCSI